VAAFLAMSPEAMARAVLQIEGHGDDMERLADVLEATQKSLATRLDMVNAAMERLCLIGEATATDAMDSEPA
jgi:hypothetical protein